MATFSLAESDKFLRVIAVTMEGAAKRGLVSAANRTVAHIRNEIIPSIKPFAPIAAGAYRAGWRAEVTDGGADVANTVPHAVFIEYGVRGSNVKVGRAMIAALAKWVRMKNIGGRVATSKGGVQRLVRPTTDEATSIAWAIAKAMQKRGVFNNGAGLGIMRMAEKRIPEFIREEVTRELKREFT